MLVAQLVSMGFSENGCRRAAIATNNAGPDQAMACKPLQKKILITIYIL